MAAERIDVLAVIEAEGALTPTQLAASGSIDDLHRWMSEATESLARLAPMLDLARGAERRAELRAEKEENAAIWRACRDELERRNHAALARVQGGAA